jgi:hypothetical protein
MISAIIFFGHIFFCMVPYMSFIIPAFQYTVFYIILRSAVTFVFLFCRCMLADCDFFQCRQLYPLWVFHSMFITSYWFGHLWMALFVMNYWSCLSYIFSFLAVLLRLYFVLLYAGPSWGCGFCNTLLLCIPTVILPIADHSSSAN